MKLKPYPKYKDLGIQGIGEIPEGWGAHKLKRISKIETGNTPSKEDDRYYINGIFPWIRPDELKEFKPIEASNFYLNEEGKLLARRIPKGSILVCCIGSLGKIGVAGVDLATNQQINSVIPNQNKFNPNFAKYIIYVSQPEYERIGNANVVAILSKNQQGEFFYCLPNIDEQQKIASFLDKKTAKIDTLIEKDKKLIALLKEKRTALINHAVTKGLDPNVKLKDSGIQWIGEIPEGWGVRKLKTISKIVLGKMLTNDDKGNYLLKPYLRAQNIFWENVDVSDIKEMWFSPNEIRIYRLSKNDLLVSEGGDAGRTAIWNEEINECYIQNSVHKVTILPEHNPRYFLYVFEMFGLLGYFESIVNRVSIGHLTREKLKEVNCIVPPLSDQTAIANYLDQNTSKIDKTIKIIEKKIKLLEEYKKSLIHYVVTGKVDVRGVEI